MGAISKLVQKAFLPMTLSKLSALAAIPAAALFAGCASVAATPGDTSAAAVSGGAGDVFTVELAEPVGEFDDVVALSTVWDCDGTTCTGTPDIARASLRNCQKFAREAGAVTAFSKGRYSLSPAEIDACNTRARS